MPATQPLRIVLSCEEKAFVGATPYFKATIYDGAQALVDPGTSVKITLTGPLGATLVNAASMTKASTGVYLYTAYTIPAASVSGVCTWRVAATDTSIVTIAESTIEVMDR